MAIFEFLINKSEVFVRQVLSVVSESVTNKTVVFYNSENLNCIGALCFFLRCVHIFFNDFDLSKRDKQVKPSGH